MAKFELGTAARHASKPLTGVLMSVLPGQSPGQLSTVSSISQMSLSHSLSIAGQLALHSVLAFSTQLSVQVPVQQAESMLQTQAGV